ncbi:hypothetical protein N7499_011325 [Penicillium canescens]|nr:hypothetical protein N7444_001355 [Penicillium canescens]KAJ6069438.1 hypothetical protein N7499_011325 [Penicillium canescens]
MANNRYTILSRRESKLRNSRSRKVRQHQDHPATKETAHPTDSSPGDEDDEMDCMDDESSYEEEEEAGSDEESSRWGPRNSPGDQRVSNSNSTLATPDEISTYAGLDASLWDNFPAGVSGHAWDPTIPSVGDTEYPGHHFNGTLPDLTTVFPDVHQSFGCNGSEVAKDGVYPSLLYPAHTDMSRFLDPGVWNWQKSGRTTQLSCLSRAPTWRVRILKVARSSSPSRKQTIVRLNH